MQLFTCPFCHRALPGNPSLHSREDFQCPSCGAALCRIPHLDFPAGDRLPSTPGKKNKTACPYCQTRYNLNYEPPDGLVGCQSCLRIFAVPMEEERNKEYCFPCGKLLPPAPQKKIRVACPYCKTRYSLNFEPQNGLLGCHSCLRIFAMPSMETLSPSGSRKNIAVVPSNTSEIPIRKGVIPNLALPQDPAEGVIPLLRPILQNPPHSGKKEK